MLSAVASHIRERNGLLMKDKVRDRPWHPPSNCESERASKSRYSLGLSGGGAGNEVRQVGGLYRLLAATHTRGIAIPTACNTGLFL
jgi:hypothetical protein